MNDIVLQDLDQGLLTITMNRPDRRNALNAEMVAGLVEAARSVLAGASWQRSSTHTCSGREPSACHPRRRERALAA